MRSMRILPLLAIVALPGCDGTGDWLRGQAAGTAYAAPLTGDTSVVTIRRVFSQAPNTGSSIIGVASIMPDGAGLATTEWPSGDPAILDLATRTYRRFHVNDAPYDRGLALQSSASPDGSQIALLWMNQRPDELEGLRVVDVATGASRMIMTRDTASEGQPYPVAWTPAGDSIFALLVDRDHRSGVQVVLVPAAGGTPRLVHSIPAGAGPSKVSLSPDGRWLAYDHEISRNQQARSDIYIIDVQRGGARPLVEHASVDALAGWLPGTDVVLFSSDRSGTTDLWSVHVANGRASGEPRLVRSGFFRSYAIGFGGGALFYGVTTGSSGAAIVNVDPQSGALGAASPPLANLSAVFWGLAWSPDGHTLAALTRQRLLHTVTLHSMETGERRVFWLDKDVTPFAAQWAADGRALFLRVQEAGSEPRSPVHFLRLDLVTGTSTRVFEGVDPGNFPFDRTFRLTPDGRSLLQLRQLGTVNDERAGMALVARSLEDGSERELHRTSGFIPEFSISRDGTQLAFVQQAWKHADSLFLMTMDGSKPLRAIARWDTDEVSLLGWLPAGNALLAARLTADGKAEEILRIELDGSTTVAGTSPFRPGRGASVPGSRRSRLVLSPAGNRLTHIVSASGEELWRMDGLYELFGHNPSARR
jgi:Tol biopolymer transport system component